MTITFFSFLYFFNVQSILIFVSIFFFACFIFNLNLNVSCLCLLLLLLWLYFLLLFTGGIKGAGRAIDSFYHSCTHLS